MNNIGELINNSISIVQKSSLFIMTFFSFLNPDTSSINTTNIEQGRLISPVNSLFVFSTPNINFLQNTPQERADEIINTLNISTGSVSTISLGKDRVIQSVQKLNQLNIVAPSYSPVRIDKNKAFQKANQNIEVNQTVSNTITSTASNQKSNEYKNMDDSVVHIRCENKTSNTIKVVTGSGVIISSSGLILTAAHVAAPLYGQQNTNKYNCYARINDPATGNYSLSVVFIDPDWVNKYYSIFDKTHSETGENDIAILQMNISGINNIKVASITGADPNIGDQITIKSYPSDVYGKLGVFTILPRKSESNAIGSLLNFDASTNGPYALLETKPSSLGQSGASGGGIFNNQGQLIGIISNSVSSDILLKNKIRGLTMNHIDSRIKTNLGKSIFEYNQ